MSDKTDRPFGHDTITSRAVFVRGGVNGLPGPTVSAALGYDAIKIPAVFVRDGATPPGYPYERFGRVVFRRDAPTDARGDSEEEASPDASEGDGEPGAALPQTRFRFGAALEGADPSVDPPNPSMAVRRGDPIKTGLGVMQGIARVVRLLATGGSMRSAAAPASGTTPMTWTVRPKIDREQE